MNIRTSLYCVKQGIVNIHRNKLFSLASIGTISACILLIGLFYSIVMNFQYMIKNMEDQVGITVFFDEKLSEDEIESIGNEIKKMNGVLSVEFTSAEEAWESFKVSYFADAPELAEGFKDDNPLANSANYTVFLDNIELQDKYVKQIDISGAKCYNICQIKGASRPDNKKERTPK